MSQSLSTPQSLRTQEMDRAPRPSANGFPPEETADVIEANVRPLPGVEGGLEARALVGNGFTYRHDWGDRNGQHKLNLNWGAVDSRSRVFVAIGEGAAGGPDAGKFLGAARYTLYNVAPQNGRVSIWVNIEWNSPIRLYVDYFVVNP